MSQGFILEINCICRRGNGKFIESNGIRWSGDMLNVGGGYLSMVVNGPSTILPVDDNCIVEPLIKTHPILTLTLVCA